MAKDNFKYGLRTPFYGTGSNSVFNTDIGAKYRRTPKGGLTINPFEDEEDYYRDFFGVDDIGLDYISETPQIPLDIQIQEEKKTTLPTNRVPIKPINPDLRTVYQPLKTDEIGLQGIPEKDYIYPKDDDRDYFMDFLSTPNAHMDMGLEQALFMGGQSLGFDKDNLGLDDKMAREAQRFNLLRGAGALGKSALNIARVVGSGMGYQNRLQNYMSNLQEQKRKGAIGTYQFAKDGGIIGGNEKIDNIQDVPVEYLATDSIEVGLPEYAHGNANSEVEGSEQIITPDGTVREVVGKKHEEGGVKINAENMTKVLSDTKTINKSTAKKLKEQYDLKVDTKTSYAEVISKFNKKSGLEELNKEQAELFKKVKGQDKLKHKVTSNLNKELLSKRISEIEDEKEKLMYQQTALAEEMFMLQEGSKGKAPNDLQVQQAPTVPIEENMNEDFEKKFGGVIHTPEFKELCKSLGMTTEQGMEILKEEGLGLRTFSTGGIIITDRPKNNFDEATIEGLRAYYSKFLPAEKVAKLDFNSLVLNPYVVDAVRNGRDLNLQTQHANEFGTYSTDATEDRAKGWVLNPQYDGFDYTNTEEVDRVQRNYNNDFKNTFGFDYNSAVIEGAIADGQYGNRTASYLRAIRQIEGNKQGSIDVDSLKGMSDAEINEALKDYGVTAKDIEPYRNLAVKYIDINPTTPQNNNITQRVIDPSKPKKDGNPDNKVGGNVAPLNREGVYSKPKSPIFLPDQSVPAPRGVSPALKVDTTYDRVEPIRVTDEAAQRELSRQLATTIDIAEGMPDPQNKAFMASVLATTQENLNKSNAQTNAINAQAQQQADLINQQTQMAEENARGANLLDYENRMYTALGRTEADVDNWIDYNRKVRLGNYNTRMKMNWLNQLYENYYLDPVTGEMMVDKSKNPTFGIDPRIVAQRERQKPTNRKTKKD